MDQKRVILAGVIALIAAAIVLGLIIAIGGLLPNLFGGNTSTSSNLPVISTSVTPAPTYVLSGTPPAQNLLTPTLTPMPTTTPTPQPSTSNSTGTINIDTKYYLGDGFSIQYPDSWGILTCSNSSNFELDPTQSTDSLNFTCNRAIKPITVLVRQGIVTCAGTSVNIGNYSVTKSTKTWTDGEVNYRWCVNVNDKTLDITHRTSVNGGTAVSTTDYSSQVEDMIKTLSTQSTNS